MLQTFELIIGMVLVYAVVRGIILPRIKAARPLEVSDELRAKLRELSIEESNAVLRAAIDVKTDGLGKGEKSV